MMEITKSLKEAILYYKQGKISKAINFLNLLFLKTITENLYMKVLVYATWKKVIIKNH